MQMIRFDEEKKLFKKLQRLERKYEKLNKQARVKRARLLKAYLATIRKIEKVTGRRFTNE